ncbi:MAG: argininosuccinate lyase [Chitinophagaceae bacterium]
MKLWQKDNTSTSALVEKFTVGNDLLFDVHLAKYDVMASIAHAKMLHSINVLSTKELYDLLNAFEAIQQSIDSGKFVIDIGIEDVHSQIEFLLTKMVGDAGKKIHTARSRNDQVATALKLFCKYEIKAIVSQVNDLFKILIALSNQHQHILMPGYTHMQIAMPSSFGLWFASFAESLVDDLYVLHAAYSIANKNPMGSGAGYGSSFNINRTYTTHELKFDTLNYNSIYAQATRGKTEKSVGAGIAFIAATLNKLASDVCLFVNQNYQFISFPSSVTTGSSIMPHKKNPDVFELVRSKTNIIQSLPNTLTLMLSNLTTGYHRDVQLTKEVLFPQIQELKNCMEILIEVLPTISINEEILTDKKYQYVFSVEEVNKLVAQGIPFRDAYKQVGESIESGKFSADISYQLNHTHEGSIGNLCNDEIEKLMNTILNQF